MAEAITKSEHNSRLLGERGIDKSSPQNSKLWELPRVFSRDIREKIQQNFSDKVLKITKEREEKLFNDRIQEGIYSEFGEVLYESREIKPGTKDLLVTSTKSGIQINGKNGYIVVPNRMIYPKNNKFQQSIRPILDAIKSGNLDFEKIQWGGLSSVGFISLPNIPIEEIAIKYLNYKPQGGFIRKNTILDGVTGVGQYVFSRKIQSHSNIHVPEPIVATNDFFVMESIKGETLRNVIEYSKHDSDWEDWWKTIIQPYIVQILESILSEERDEYWQPDYIQLDIHEGNIIINEDYHNTSPPKTLEESLNMFTLIDSIR